MSRLRDSGIPTVFVLLLLLVSVKAEYGKTGSRSILRAKLVEEAKEGDFAVDLNATNFDDAFRETTVPHVVLEFFAHWCPACRHYKPQYEKVAKLFNGRNAANPGIVLMTRVDCALKINTKLCEKFSVGHYPTLFWGPPSKFVSGSWKPNDEKSEITEISEWRNAGVLLSWINKQLNSSYALEDENLESDKAAFGNSIRVANAAFDVEEATHNAFDIILQLKAVKSSTRASLINFLQLLVAHHPSWRCRKGTAEVLINFDEMFPSDDQKTPNDFYICGNGVPRGYWKFCQGSRNDTRGFSCGLWVLLHSISVRVSDAESHFAFTSICEFIHNFFICEECRQHFYTMCSNTKEPIKTARDLSLWLWSAHNQVNERLMKEEAMSETGDPKFPKAMWPPKNLCPSCRLSVVRNTFDQSEWNLDKVYHFLTSYYGSSVVSSKEKDEAGGGVPLRAVVAIALSSCCLGGVACYWRSLQKNRKYFHYPHSSKNI